MSTFTILAGFALMLFLPCAVAMLGTRDKEETSAYSDRTIELATRGHFTHLLQTSAEMPASSAVLEASGPTASQSSISLEAADPVLPNRTQKTHNARILRNEIEALMATAAATRAQADALAANARLAAAKAEAADAAATAAEDAAATAIQEMRKAA